MDAATLAKTFGGVGVGTMPPQQMNTGTSPTSTTTPSTIAPVVPYPDQGMNHPANLAASLGGGEVGGTSGQPGSSSTQDNGIVQSLAQGVAGTVLPFVSSVRDIAGDVAQIPKVVTGGQFTPTNVSDYGYFGNHPAVGNGANIFEPITTPRNLTALKGAIGQGIETGSMLIPGGEVAGLGKGVLPSLWQMSKLGGASVGSYSLGQSLKDDQNLKDTAINTGEGVATGMALGPAFGVSAKTVGGVAKFATTPAEKLRQEAVQTGVEEQMGRLKGLNHSYGENTVTRDGITTTPTDTLAKYNAIPEVKDTRVQMGHVTNQQKTGILDEELKNQNYTLDNHLKDITKNGYLQPLPIDNFQAIVEKEIQNNPNLMAAGKVSKAITEADRMFKDYRVSYGKEIPGDKINDIRKAMNKEYNPDTVDVERAIGNVTRDYLYNSTPDQFVRSNLLEQQKIIAARDFSRKLDQTVVKGGRMGLYVARTIGAMMGNTLDKIPFKIGPFIGAFGGDMVARELQNLTFKSPSAELKALLEKVFQRSKIKDTNNTAMTTSNMKYSIPQLEAPKPGSPQFSNTVPINLPKESATTVGKRELANFGKNYEKQPPLELPPGGKATGATINMPQTSQTARDAAETAKFGKQYPKTIPRTADEFLSLPQPKEGSLQASNNVPINVTPNAQQDISRGFQGSKGMGRDLKGFVTPETALGASAGATVGAAAVGAYGLAKSKGMGTETYTREAQTTPQVPLPENVHPINSQEVINMKPLIDKAENAVKNKLGVTLPKGFMTTLVEQESSMGTNESSKNIKIGKNAWVTGLTQGAKEALDKAGLKYNTDTKEGAIEAAALYAGLRFQPKLYDKTRDLATLDTKQQTNYKNDPALFYAERYRGASSQKDIKYYRDLFDKKYQYYSSNS